MPHLVKKAPNFKTFASLSLPELYTPEALETAQRLEANTLATTVFRNHANGKFSAEPLPVLSQLAPVMAISVADVNQDGRLDLILGQNFNAAQRETGRMNAGLGVVLLGQKDGSLRELWPAESGLQFRDDTRQLLAEDLDGDRGSDLWRQ